MAKKAKKELDEEPPTDEAEPPKKDKKKKKNKKEKEEELAAEAPKKTNTGDSATIKRMMEVHDDALKALTKKHAQSHESQVRVSKQHPQVVQHLAFDPHLLVHARDVPGDGPWRGTPWRQG